MKKLIIFCSILFFASTIGLANDFTLFSPLTSSVPYKFSLVKDYSFALSLPDPSKIEFAVTKSPDKKCISKSKKKDWLFIGLSSSLMMISVLDVHSTFRGLDNNADLYYEGNPLLSKIIHNRPLFAVTDVALTGLAVYLFSKSKKRYKTLTYIALSGAILLRGYIVYRNYRIGGPSRS